MSGSFAERLRTYDWERTDSTGQPDNTGWLLDPPDYDPRKSLAPVLISWIQWHCTLSGGKKMRVDDDLANTLMRWYALNDEGLPQVSQGFLVRAKGVGKSFSMSCLAYAELFGPVRFAGWAKGGEIATSPSGWRYQYSPGEPMGKAVEIADIRILATKEDQARTHVLRTVNRFVKEGPWANEVVRATSSVIKVNKGTVGVYPSNAPGEDGQEHVTCYLLDELHEWSVGGDKSLGKLFTICAQNARKANEPTAYLFGFTTAWAPGRETVISQAFDMAEAIARGEALNVAPGICYDHLKASELHDLSKPDELMKALRESHGQREWIPYRNHIAGLATIDSIANFRRYTLSQIVAQENALAAKEELTEVDKPRDLAPGDIVTLGIDLSKGSIAGANSRIKRIPDASTFVAVRVEDGAVFVLWHDETTRAELEANNNYWEPDIETFMKVFEEAFEKYKVVAVWADESHYVREFAKLSGKYGRRLKFPLPKPKPMSFFFTNRSKVTDAVTVLRDTIANGALPIGDGPFPGGREILFRHLMNAQIVSEKGSLRLEKADGVNGVRKMDAAIAAMLAVGAANHARSMGENGKPRPQFRVRFLSA